MIVFMVFTCTSPSLLSCMVQRAVSWLNERLMGRELSFPTNNTHSELDFHQRSYLASIVSSTMLLQKFARGNMSRATLPCALANARIATFSLIAGTPLIDRQMSPLLKSISAKIPVSLIPSTRRTPSTFRNEISCCSCCSGFFAKMNFAPGGEGLLEATMMTCPVKSFIIRIKLRGLVTLCPLIDNNSQPSFSLDRNRPDFETSETTVVPFFSINDNPISSFEFFFTVMCTIVGSEIE
mmetsp:Transcript_21350/g.30576  ORF Transcript_21350/g.30576 Transcript_21350/m.30576 type:complete len:238 (-) Transcript_21350:892-1605(-)